MRTILKWTKKRVYVHKRKEITFILKVLPELFNYHLDNVITDITLGNLTQPEDKLSSN